MQLVGAELSTFVKNREKEKEIELNLQPLKHGQTNEGAV